MRASAENMDSFADRGGFTGGFAPQSVKPEEMRFDPSKL